MAEQHDSWLAGLGIDVQRFFSEAAEKIKGVKETVDGAKKVATADYGSETPTESVVDPGAAEESLKDFAEDVKTTSKKLKQAKGVLEKVKGESDLAKAVGQTSEALDQVSEGLDKVGEGAEKVLKVAAAVRKLEECRRVLVRVQAVDFTQTDRRVENAKAMGDLAKLFGEFGAQATDELPMLKGYFQLISRLGEIWVPFARMVDRREKEAMAASESGDAVPAPAEAQGPAADTSRVIALADVKGYLYEQLDILQSTTNPALGLADRHRRIVRDHDFDENFDELLVLVERSHGLKAEMEHFIAEKTPLELPGEKYRQKDLAEKWTPCHDAVVELKALGDLAWMGVTYEPALRALEAVRPKKA